jgi:hypothetical protein
MMGVSVQYDPRQIRDIERFLGASPKKVKRVMVSSINKVARWANTRVVRGVASEVAVKQAELKRRNIKLSKANYTRTHATIRIRGARIPLVRFGARQLKRAGVSYRIEKGGKRKKAKSAFIEIMRGGHEGVFKRRGPASLPIDELYGPSVPAVFGNVAQFAENQLDRAIANRLELETGRQIERVLKRGRARR